MAKHVLITLFAACFVLFSCVKRRGVEALDESPSEIGVSQSEDSVYVYWSWYNYQMKSFQVQFSFSKQDVDACAENRKEQQASTIVPNTPDYGMLVSHDLHLLNQLVGQLKQIALANQMDVKQTTELVVTMVQNMQYTMVHPLSHKEIDQQEALTHSTFVRDYHKDETHRPFDKSPYGGCEENVNPGGIFSPVEFLASLKGDCDTRTVTIYALLKAMDLPSIVVNGPGHSMLAVPYAPYDPTSPYLEFKGSRYYFWETTLFYINGEQGEPQIGQMCGQDIKPQEWYPVLY